MLLLVACFAYKIGVQIDDRFVVCAVCLVFVQMEEAASLKCLHMCRIFGGWVNG